MKEMTVSLSDRSYRIVSGRGVLSQAGALVRSVFGGEKIAVVTDSNVGPLYAADVLKELQAAGFAVRLITVPAGEKSKSPDMLLHLYHEMLAFGLTRTDLIVALGGGVVGDLTGFAAATLLRGVPFVQIPTTLLAQVDSSVGGKVAIDLPEGKNLVGAFYQPKLVILDPGCLATLPQRVLSDGMAEVIKYGAIKDRALFEMLENIRGQEEVFAKMEKIIYTCCDIKRQVVEADEFDTGGRMILNFGHTFGHAIEKQYHYETYTHGEAVGIGMVMACAYGEKCGLTKPGTADRIRAVLQNFHLPTDVPLARRALLDAVAVDKKGTGSKLRLILLREIGDVMIQEIDKSDI